MGHTVPRLQSLLPENGVTMATMFVLGCHGTCSYHDDVFEQDAVFIYHTNLQKQNGKIILLHCLCIFRWVHEVYDGDKSQKTVYVNIGEQQGMQIKLVNPRESY